MRVWLRDVIRGAWVVVAWLGPFSLAAAQPLPPGDTRCIREMARGIAAFQAVAIEEVLRARIERRGPSGPSPELGQLLRDVLAGGCPEIPLYSQVGICGGIGSVETWIDCVVATQEVAVVAFADALLAGAVLPTPTPSPPRPATPTVAVTPPPTPQPPACAGRLFACTARNCCPGLLCRLTGLSRDPICVPEPPQTPSASGAFLDADAARFF